MLFVNQAGKDLLGFAFLLILGLFGFSVAYHSFFSQMINEDTGEKYTFVESMAFVCDQAVGGYTNIPGETAGTPV